MTTKQKFEVENPEVVVLNNGRYAYKAVCPWKGKNDKDLTAFKFCGSKDYAEYTRYLESLNQSDDSADADPPPPTSS